MRMGKRHTYSSRVVWTGAGRGGTTGYEAYSRAHRIEPAGKPPIEGSADPLFRGEDTRYNPEDLLLASLSACHMLWYLHLCADAGVVVVAYEDEPTAEMELAAGSGQFVEATLNPQVTVAAGSDAATARRLHAQAHANCFIARSVNFPVRHRATVASTTTA